MSRSCNPARYSGSSSSSLSSSFSSSSSSWSFSSLVRPSCSFSSLPPLHLSPPSSRRTPSLPSKLSRRYRPEPITFSRDRLWLRPPPLPPLLFAVVARRWLSLLLAVSLEGVKLADAMLWFLVEMRRPHSSRPVSSAPIISSEALSAAAPPPLPPLPRTPLLLLPFPPPFRTSDSSDARRLPVGSSQTILSQNCSAARGRESLGSAVSHSRKFGLQGGSLLKRSPPPPPPPPVRKPDASSSSSPCMNSLAKWQFCSNTQLPLAAATFSARTACASTS
mmetsp:Transcript_76289/g.149463  ORF Transcript_76289/g.149463 Transcript_76289/m.149463 type:complete len:277 (+) Transcript_76289:795-1625(+)